MSIIPLATLKEHLRITHGEEDATITIYLEAAEKSVGKRIQRTIVAAEAAPTGDEVAMSWDIQAAVLLLAAHLYENRVAVVAGATVAVLPMSVDFLLAPYRLWGAEA